MQELTKDPHMYPGKNTLAHVSVAMRVNAKLSKKIRSGDIVSYVICDVSSLWLAGWLAVVAL